MAVKAIENDSPAALWRLGVLKILTLFDQEGAKGVLSPDNPANRRDARTEARFGIRLFGLLLAGVLLACLALTGCVAPISGANASGGISSDGSFQVTPGTAVIDTNCTGCNGGSVELFSATLSKGGAAAVTWSLPTGGNYGTINTSTGQYTPPGYLTSDVLQVTVTATLTSNSSAKASAVINVSPGFLQPLSPENLALGAGSHVQISGYLAEAGGTTGINYALSGTATGTSGGQGTLSGSSCVRSSQAFTFCTVTYTAPATISATGATYIVATVGSLSSESTVVLLNTDGVDSNPLAHQAQQGSAILLGSSGGNNFDYDTSNGNIVDCCGGTLGSLVKNASGTQYLLSNNHVLARSDQATAGESIIQPGLIEDGCTPYGQPGAKVTPVGALYSWLQIKSSTTNVDAALAQVNSGAVNASGAILELGAKQADGTLTAAPPGISSTNGKGETASIGLSVAKSGRTTGLTCASVSAVSLDVNVEYFDDCAETKPYLTKTYINQVAITGNEFSDAGDSGSLVVDSNNAEPVGLFFAGGKTNTGLSEGVANPVGEVLSELGVATGTSYTFVGTTDHPVSCLNYGNATAVAAQAVTLSDAEQTRAEQALMQGRTLVNPSAGIFGVAMGKSSDSAGEATLIVYVDPNANVSVPVTVGGVRTAVIAASAQAVATGVAPRSIVEASVMPAFGAAALQKGLAVKQQVAAGVMAQTPAFFGVGVGQSFDNPKESALVVYVDRKQVPASLPATMGGMRTRYVIMDRLHVTRAYLSPTPVRSHCLPQAAPAQRTDWIGTKTLRELSGMLR